MKEKCYPPSYNSRKYVLLSPILLTASPSFFAVPKHISFRQFMHFLRSTTRSFCRVFVHTFNWCNTSPFFNNDFDLKAIHIAEHAALTTLFTNRHMKSPFEHASISERLHLSSPLTLGKRRSLPT